MRLRNKGLVSLLESKRWHKINLDLKNAVIPGFSFEAIVITIRNKLDISQFIFNLDMLSGFDI